MITCSNIAYGDQLGAQLTKLAELIYLSQLLNQQLVFFKELSHFRRGYQFLDYFDIRLVLINKLPEKNTISNIYNFLTKKRNMHSWKTFYSNRIYALLDKIYYTYILWHYKEFVLLNTLKDSVNYDNNLLKCAQDSNYNITSGFGTYQDWKAIENVIMDMYKLKKEIQEEARNQYSTYKSRTKREIVSVHFRKTDYLVLSSLNLDDDYYTKALQYFSADQYALLIFSDDIESCKDSSLFVGYEVFYSYAKNPGIDLCIMSLCDHNIIANSSFSFWGAFLNKNINKKVVYPYDYMGQSAKEFAYVNGNYYPSGWIAI
jgi:hypothetical protein